MEKSSGKIRIDKWLWAARFYKTRSLAANAINSGKVLIEGCKVKSSRLLCGGEKIQIGKGEIQFHITVLALSAQRRSATEAALLYEEDEASKKIRLDIIEMKRLQHASQAAPQRKPDKRDRRKIREFIRKD